MRKGPVLAPAVWSGAFYCCYPVKQVDGSANKQRKKGGRVGVIRECTKWHETYGCSGVNYDARHKGE